MNTTSWPPDPALPRHAPAQRGVLVDATVGWREWVALPELGVARLAAKTDTGARTSSLHALDIEPFQTSTGEDWVRFRLHPLHGNHRFAIACSAPLIGQRTVRSSNGQRSQRFVIATAMQLGPRQQRIELTLANRGPMNYGMLLGRRALAEGDWMVDCRRAFLQGRPSVSRRAANADSSASPAETGSELPNPGIPNPVEPVAR